MSEDLDLNNLRNIDHRTDPNEKKTHFLPEFLRREITKNKMDLSVRHPVGGYGLHYGLSYGGRVG